MYKSKAKHVKKLELLWNKSETHEELEICIETKQSLMLLKFTSSKRNFGNNENVGRNDMQSMIVDDDQKTILK